MKQNQLNRNRQLKCVTGAISHQQMNLRTTSQFPLHQGDLLNWLCEMR